MSWTNVAATVVGEAVVVGALGLMVRDVVRTHRGDAVAAAYLQALEYSTLWGQAPDYSRLPWAAQRRVLHTARREAFRAVCARKGMAELSAMVADPQVGRAPGRVVIGRVVAAPALDRQWWRKDDWQQQEVSV